MGRGDHPHVERLDLVGAQRLDLLLLQHAQQLGLQRQRQVADLVEEQRAAVGHLELADARLAVGTGKGAGGGAEQLGLHQAFRNRRDIDRDEGPARPRREVMDALGQQLLAGAGLATQQHRGIELRGAPRLALDFAGGRAVADETGNGVTRPACLGQFVLGGDQLGLQAGVLGHQRLEVAGAVEQHEAQRADQGAVLVAQRNAGDHEVLVAEGHQVEHARLAAFHHLAQAAGRQHFLDLLAEHAGRIANTDLLGVLVVDPDDARLTVDRDGALTLRVEVIEQQRHGHGTETFRGYADDQAVVVECVAGNAHGQSGSVLERPIMVGPGCHGQGNRDMLRAGNTLRSAARWPVVRNRTPGPGRAVG